MSIVWSLLIVVTILLILVFGCLSGLSKLDKITRQLYIHDDDDEDGTGGHLSSMYTEALEGCSNLAFAKKLVSMESIERARGLLDRFTDRADAERDEWLSRARDYKLRIEAESTGIYPTWSSNTGALSEMLHVMRSVIKYARSFSDELSKKCILLVDDFLARMDEALSIAQQRRRMRNCTNENDATECPITRLLHHVPWPNDPAVFRVQLTRIIMEYLLLNEAMNRKRAADLALRIMENPRQSMGSTLTDYQSYELMAPWLVAMYYGSVTCSHGTREFWQLLDELALARTDVPYAKGVHIDASHMRTDGNFDLTFVSRLSSLNVRLLIALLPTRTTAAYLEAHERLMSILAHPTMDRVEGVLPIRTYGLFEKRASSPRGFRVLPLVGFLRYYTDDVYFEARAFVSGLNYVEPRVPSRTQESMQLRYRVSRRKGLYHFGTIANTSSTDSDALVSSTYSREKARLCDNARSFVLYYGDLGVLYQKYTLPDFGPHTISELLVVRPSGITAQIFIHVSYEETDTRYYYRHSGSGNVDDGSNAIALIGAPPYTINVSVPFDDAPLNVSRAEWPNRIAFPIRLDDDIRIEQYDGYWVLFDVDQPKICFPFAFKTQESEDIRVRIHGESNPETVFRFDAEQNQWLVR